MDRVLRRGLADVRVVRAFAVVGLRRVVRLVVVLGFSAPGVLVDIAVRLSTQIGLKRVSAALRSPTEVSNMCL